MNINTGQISRYDKKRQVAFHDGMNTFILNELKERKIESTFSLERFE